MCIKGTIEILKTIIIPQVIIQHYTMYITSGTNFVCDYFKQRW